MQFELSEDQRAYPRAPESFRRANSSRMPRVGIVSIFSRKTPSGLQDLGFMGMYTPESAGGLGMSPDANLIVEELAKGCHYRGIPHDSQHGDCHDRQILPTVSHR